jgi:hypothetical protein
MQEPTPEQTAVIADLHWLIHEGHVIEFANGRIETAKKPIPKPPKPTAKPAMAAAGPVSSDDALPIDPPATAETGSPLQRAAASGSVPETLEIAQQPAVQNEAVDSSAGTAPAPSEPAVQSDRETAQAGSA